MIFAIRQDMPAGVQFDGNAHDGGGSSDVDGVRLFDPTGATAGGLFDLASILPGLPLEIPGIQILNGPSVSAWTVDIIDGSDAIPLTSGTTEEQVLYFPSTPLILLPGQNIRITTTGAANAHWAAVQFARSGRLSI